MSNNKNCETCKFWALWYNGNNMTKEGYCTYNGKPNCVNGSMHKQK